MDWKPLSDRLAGFPRLGLAHLPTPIEPMKRLTAHLGGPRLWVKREDATGLGFGGNKLRKLDYVLHEAVSSGADTIVSGGVVQSNSQRQVAAVAAKLGLACHLAVYHGRLEPPTPEQAPNVPSPKKQSAADPVRIGRNPCRPVVALFVVTFVRARADSASVPPPAAF